MRFLLFGGHSRILLTSQFVDGCELLCMPGMNLGFQFVLFGSFVKFLNLILGFRAFECVNLEYRILFYHYDILMDLGSDSF